MTRSGASLSWALSWALSRRRPRILYLALGTAGIAAAFASIFTALWWMAEDRIDRAFATEADKVHNGFVLAIDGVHSQMQALATLVAGDEAVQSHFARGARAVAGEGGGPGGEEAAQARSQLLGVVNPQWQLMQRRFGARQLHFHLTPKDTVVSFLRVHAPTRFGDRLDDVRTIIADVAHDGLPRAGFEMGRIYSGLRGVVPLVVYDGMEARRVGVLEAGSSFDAHLDTLDHQFGGGVAILLRKDMIDEVVWQEYLELNGQEVPGGCQCYLEATSRSDIIDLMRSGAIRPLNGAPLEVHRVERNGRTFNLVRFPLKDYAGTVEPGRPPVGSVAIWIDRTALIDQERSALALQGGLTAAAFLLALGLFLVGSAYAGRRRAAERALQAERALFVGGPVAVFVWRPEDGWPVEHASSNVITLTGYTAQDLMASHRRFIDLVHPDDRLRLGQEVTAFLAEGRSSWEQSYRLVRRDGSTVWTYDFTIVERTADDTILRMRGYLVDITARMELEERLFKIAANLPGMIFQFEQRADGTSCFPYASDGIRDIFGPPPQDVALDAGPIFGVIHPDDLPAVRAAIADSAVSLAPWRSAFRVRHPLKGEIWVAGDAIPDLTAAGSVLWHGFIADITDRKRAEAALQESELRFRQLADVVDVVFWVRTADEMLYVSPAYERVWGRSAQSLYDNPRSFLDAVHPDDMPRVVAAMTTEFGGRDHFDEQYRIIRPDGAVRWIHATSQPVLDHQGHLIRSAGTATDITAIKQTELALAQNEERYRSVVAAMAEGIIIQDRDGRIIASNPAAERILGMSQEAMLGLTSGDPRWRAIRADGTPFAGEDHATTRCRRDGRSVRGDIMGLPNASGGTTWISINAEPLRASASDPRSQGPGALVGVVASFSDITARHKAEQELLRSNAELEQFAYVASHDLRQPLRMISSYLTLVDRSLGDGLDPQVKEFMGFAVDGAKRMDRLIVDLLEYSRIGRMKRPMRPLDLAAVVAEALGNLTVPIRDSGAEVTVAPDLPTVRGDHSEIMRLFQNLIGNAVKYAAPGRPPRITIDWQPAAHGEGWVIRVSDNGAGIEAKDFERIFGVFQRLVTRSEVEGTGIGLAVCRKIAEHHGGRIWVDSTRGEGSTFSVLLPRRPDAAPDAPAEVRQLEAAL